jgi:hypothetical protein
MAAFQFYLQSGKQKSRVGGGRRPCFWLKIPWGERKCETVHCGDATVRLSPKFGPGCSHIFMKLHGSVRNWLFGLPGQILCEQSIPLMSKKMMNMLLVFFFTCLVFFSLSKFVLSVYGSRFLSRTLVYSLPGSLSHLF